MDYQALIHVIIDPLVSNPKELLIREVPSTKDDEISFLICTQNEDIARLIGKKGTTANAIREILSIAGKLEEKKVYIKFETFDEENKE